MSNKYISLIASLVLMMGLSGCPVGSDKGDSSGSGGNATGTTTFAGGTVDDLKKISPNLVFEDLIITGKLTLPLYSSTTLSVKSLSVTSSGSVGYTYSTCTYASAPDLTVNATGDVSIAGYISLSGRSGTSVTSGAVCNSCYGQNGGNINITAANLKIDSQLLNYGGYGATYSDSYGSSGCRGGNSGYVTLTATNTDLSGSSIESNAGRGGAEGFGYGPSGTASKISLETSAKFTMNPGSIDSDGTFKFRATQTDIVGPITYGTLDNLINGVADQIAPVAIIQAPVSGATVQLGQPLKVQVQAGDTGMGVRDINIKGFGYNQTLSAITMQNGLFNMEIPAPQADSVLQVTVRDNALHETVASVVSLLAIYGAEQEPNNSLATVQTLSFPVAIQGSISPSDTGTCDSTIASNWSDTNCIYHTAQDYFTFKVPENGNYEIKLEFNNNAAATDLDLYLDSSATGSGWWVYSRADNNLSKVYTEIIQASFVTNDTYTLAIQAWPSWAGTANYRLTIRKVQ